MIKAIKVLNRISVLLFSAIFLLVYAYLPIAVDLGIEEVGQLHKQNFFYYFFGAFMIINILLRVTTNLGTKNLKEEISSWIRSIVFIVNFYLTTMVGFIGVLNNTNHINPESYAYLSYLGPTLLVIWVIGLIFLLLKNK
ncbi:MULTISPECIES: hypothetical protein [unclassified Ekhidna]|uniref:hypothetical protein n=1 Tax=unclassified Ekhidna TaxID=2632188 RepID=UPI0032E0197E